MRKNETELRRNQIKESLTNILNEQNLNKINVTDVSKESGLSRKTIYVYYNSKDDILLDIYADSLLRRYELADYAIKNCKTLKEKLYKVAQVSFNYYKKDKAALLIHIYWSNLNFDFSKINEKVSEKFKKANNAAYSFLNENLFHSFIEYKSDYDFYLVNYLDNIHSIIKRALLEPEFWSYKGKSVDYFEKAIQLYLKGLKI